MKIFIVASGDYSAHGIDAVFTTREFAEAYIALHDLSPYDIEEWDANADVGKRNVDIYRVELDVNSGEAWQLAKRREFSFLSPRWSLITHHKHWSREAYLITAESAVSQEYALKIAVEYRQSLLRENPTWVTRA